MMLPYAKMLANCQIPHGVASGVDIDAFAGSQ